MKFIFVKFSVIKFYNFLPIFIYDFNVFIFFNLFFFSSKELSKSVLFKIIVSYNYNKAFFLILQYFFLYSASFCFTFSESFM